MKKIILTLLFFSIVNISFAYNSNQDFQRNEKRGSGQGYGRVDNNLNKNMNNEKNNLRNGQNSSDGTCVGWEDIINGEKYDLTDQEKDFISHMREEEKIARDVYTRLYEKWDIRSFGNIKNSEQQHMDAIKILIDKYELEDSMESNEIGIFKSPEFQKLYDDLIAKGMKSEIDALQVGMTIEDVDIYDLERFLTETTNQDVQDIFNNLNQASMNHARAFQRQLDMRAGEYSAQYISSERLSEILEGSDQRKNRGNGNVNNFGCHGDLDCINQRMDTEKIVVNNKNIKNNNYKKKYNNLQGRNTESNNQNLFDRLINALKFWNWF